MLASDSKNKIAKLVGWWSRPQALSVYVPMVFSHRAFPTTGVPGVHGVEP